MQRLRKEASTYQLPLVVSADLKNIVLEGKPVPYASMRYKVGGCT